MSPITQAIQRGMARGMSLAANPTIENFRNTRTQPSQNITTEAWKAVSKSIHEAMGQFTRDSTPNTPTPDPRRQ